MLPCSMSIKYGPGINFRCSFISKFQFDLDYCQALHHEPLARLIGRLAKLSLCLTLNLHLLFFIRPHSEQTPNMTHREKLKK